MKCRGVLKSQFVSNLADGLLRVEYQVFGNLRDFELDVFLCRLARLLFNQVAEIVGRQAEIRGTVFYSRQTVLLSLPFCEIVVEQPFKTGENVLVGIGAGDKLPFVEAQAIIQQCLDVNSDEALAVAVNSVFKLVLNLLKAIDE